jgi:hypothetical protein
MHKAVATCSLLCFLFLTQCRKEDTHGRVNTLNNRSVGASANEFLGSSKFQSLDIEIAYMPGFVPDITALNNLQNYLIGLVNKPGGIRLSQRAIPASGKTVLTLAEIRELETNNRTVFSSGTSLGVFIIYTDGAYSEANTLGVAHKNTSIAIFGKTVHDNSGGVNQASRTKLETLTMEHEYGHLLGLVNLGSPMQVDHKDPATNHCNNSSCLMYYETQVGQMGGILVSGPVPSLDANCRNDLKANGGK